MPVKIRVLKSALKCRREMPAYTAGAKRPVSKATDDGDVLKLAVAGWLPRGTCYVLY